MSRLGARATHLHGVGAEDEVTATAESSSEAAPSAWASQTHRWSRQGLAFWSGRAPESRSRVASQERDARAAQGGSGSGLTGGRRPWRGVRDAPKVAASEVGIRRSGASWRQQRSPWCPIADRGGRYRAELGILRERSILLMPRQCAIEGEDRGRRHAWAFSKPEAAAKAV